MIINSYDEALKVLLEGDNIDFETSFSLSQYCSKYARDPESQRNSRDVVIRIQDAWERIPEVTHQIWNDLCDSVGLFPYIKPEFLAPCSLIRYEYHSSKYLENIFFHQEQNDVSVSLLSNESIVLSAPTSFGKSLLIEEIIASKIHSNIVVVQPTLALLDETRKKLLKYSKDYQIVVSTNQEPSSILRNVFLFTPERVIEYDQFPDIDFFVIDEFYKLSLDRRDDRGVILNQALGLLLNKTENFYFLGPNVASILHEFQEQYKFSWLDSQFATVAVDEQNIDTHGLDSEQIETKLFELLCSLTDQTLIYCRSPQRTEILVEQFISYLEENVLIQKYATENNDDIAEWIRYNIHDRWLLKRALQTSIAFHHASIPRHLGSAIIDGFNNGDIQYVFCTSTIIEGVNTSAKNVILFDRLKGQRRIDYFDYRNIKGRSGRMAQHFIGRVFNFHPQPEEENINVDIPLITQDKAPEELLIQINDVKLKESSKKRLSDFDSLDENLQLIIKKNSGISIEGQINLVQEIEKYSDSQLNLLQWDTSMQSYDQLLFVLDIAWRHLQKRSEHNIVTPTQLTFLSRRYSLNQSAGALISEDLNSEFWIKREPSFEKRVNRVVFSNLDRIRHWFDFRLPKLLSVVSNLQNYVLSKIEYEPGDYSAFANSLERGQYAPNVAMLLDYNVPSSAITKISKYVNPDDSAETVFHMIATTDPRSFDLIPYEINKIRSVTENLKI